jgi:septum formation protein
MVACSSMQDPDDTLVLASASPRRSSILARLGLPHRIVWRELDETALSAGLDPRRAPEILARRKVEAVMNAPEARDCRLILGADTVIVFGERLIGKPSTAREAARLLEEFSGRWHEVVTGVCLFDRASAEWTGGSEIARVLFAPLSPSDIAWYVKCGEWRGAAGAYRIQERGECLIERIEGNPSTIMGLPIRLIYGMLTSQNHPRKGKFPSARNQD